MNEEKQLRIAMALIQDAKECLSPMNNEDKTLWNATCDLELIRSTIEQRLKYYMGNER